jgi:hypothetical protein
MTKKDDWLSVWVDRNRSSITKHWLAVHPDKGILVAEADAECFADRVEGLPSEERDAVVTFHGSLYF